MLPVSFQMLLTFLCVVAPDVASTCLGLGQSSVHPTPQSSSGYVQVNRQFSVSQMYVLS